jgi:hypothetical protein
MLPWSIQRGNLPFKKKSKKKKRRQRARRKERRKKARQRSKEQVPFFDNGKMKLLAFAEAVPLSWVLGIFSVGVHLE